VYLIALAGEPARRILCAEQQAGSCCFRRAANTSSKDDFCRRNFLLQNPNTFEMNMRG